MLTSYQPVTTIDELFALPDDGLRYELLEGEHVFTQLFRALAGVVHGRDDVALFASPADVVLGPKRLVQPDLFVARRTPDKPRKAWADVGVPLLAIEILSPSTAGRDREKTRRIYQQAGVAEYWMVDLDAHLIERWHPHDDRPEMVDGVMRWTLPGGAGGEFELKQIFRELG